MPRGRRFTDDATEVFRVMRPEDLDKDAILDFIERFRAQQLPRLEELMNYYRNNSAINDREDRDETRADNRLSHNYARLISTLIQGYFMGKPVTYSHEDDALIEQITEFMDLNDEQSHNAQLELHLSIFGRAFEMLYNDEETNARLALVDPRECFVIYDATVQMKPVAAVRHYLIRTGDDEYQGFVEVYTAENTARYRSGEEFDELTDEEITPNYYDGVNVIEYWNNDERMGDFENVLDQIDAYDKAQSDTANEQEDFASAYLVLEGMPDTNSEDVEKMEQTRVIVMPEGTEGSKPKAYYLTKQYDVQGVEAYKDRLVDDIHKLSFVPDITDSQFAGQMTGEAMKYKLFLLDQVKATKERLYKRGLMTRFRLLSAVWSIRNRPNEGIEKINITFTVNTPKNRKEIMEMIKGYLGIVSNQTLLSWIPEIEDVREEMELLEEEQQSRQPADDFNFGNQGGGTDDEA